MPGQIDWKALRAVLIARAWGDQAFRMALISDPRAAIEQAGLALPKGIDLRVVEGDSGVPVEEKLGVRYLVLPPKP